MIYLGLAEGAKEEVWKGEQPPTELEWERLLADLQRKDHDRQRVVFFIVIVILVLAVASFMGGTTPD